MKSQMSTLIDQLNDLQNGHNWIGTNYQNKIDPLTEKAFFYKSDQRHSVAEIISHLTTWRSETALKVISGEGSMTDTHESNWKSNEFLQSLGKDKLLKDYQTSLMDLTELLKNKDDSFLDDMYYDNDFKGKFSYSFVLRGMLHHDLYHLGQIGLLIKLLPPGL